MILIGASAADDPLAESSGGLPDPDLHVCWTDGAGEEGGRASLDRQSG